MHKFKITLSQVLDDGDTALVEEHRGIEFDHVQDIIAEYAQRAMKHDYVVSYNALVERH